MVVTPFARHAAITIFAVPVTEASSRSIYFPERGLRQAIGLPGTPIRESMIKITDNEEYDNQADPVACSKDSAKVDKSCLYDIVYMDANKREYCEYYDLVFDMVRPGGLILADNVIWDGKVCQDPLPQDKQTLSIVKFNDMVSADPRVESVILPLRDGINVIRKK